MQMNAKHQEVDPAKKLEENSGNSSSGEVKRSIKNRLGRLFLTTEFRNKDKKFLENVIEAKNELYNAFCAKGVFESAYMNRIFWLYADKDKDIAITKAQLLIPKYLINIPEIPEEETIKLTQYIKILRFIRNSLNPIMHQIKSLVSNAKKHAEKRIRLESTDEVYSTYDSENEKLAERTIAKDRLKESLEEIGYDRNRFTGEKAVISDSFEENNYQNLMVFALFGFHYFNKKHEVYDAFMPEQHKDIVVSLDIPGFRKTNISLGIFLKIMEHLDFQKLFSL